MHWRTHTFTLQYRHQINKPLIKMSRNGCVLIICLCSIKRYAIDIRFKILVLIYHTFSWDGGNLCHCRKGAEWFYLQKMIKFICERWKTSSWKALQSNKSCYVYAVFLKPDCTLLCYVYHFWEFTVAKHSFSEHFEFRSINVVKVPVFKKSWIGVAIGFNQVFVFSLSVLTTAL